MTDADFASVLVVAQAADVLALFGGAASAQTTLSRDSLTFGQTGRVVLPNVTASTNASFVGEGQPIPVTQFAASSLLLVRKKIATIIPFTRQTFEGSALDMETVVSDTMTAVLGFKMDLIYSALIAAARCSPLASCTHRRVARIRSNVKS